MKLIIQESISRFFELLHFRLTGEANNEVICEVISAMN